MSANLQPFLSAGGFITAGNITTASYASPAPTINGFSSISGLELVTVSGLIDSGVTTVVTDGINSIALAPGATMDVFGFPFSAAGIRGQLTISGITSTTQANGTWYYESTSDIAYKLYTDATYSTLVDATGWTAYTGGGSVAITQHSTAPNVIIDSNGYFSKFDNTGNVTLPGDLSVVGGVINLTGEGVIRSNYDTVSIQSYDVANSIAYGLRVGDNGGVYLEQGTTPSWLYFEPNAGNAQITSGLGTSGGAGKNLTITAGAADQTDYYTTSGGNVNITGGLGAQNDGGGGGPGGAVNLTSGASSDPAGRYGNITINTGGANTWTFDYTGNLTAPGNITGNTAGYAIGYRDIPQVSFTGNATISTTDAGKHYYSTLSTGNVLTIANNASQGFQIGSAITIVNQGTGNITVAQGSGVTLYLAGNATSGNRSVATFGMATLIKVATNTWFISGAGVA